MKKTACLIAITGVILTLTATTSSAEWSAVSFNRAATRIGWDGRDQFDLEFQILEPKVVTPLYTKLSETVGGERVYEEDVVMAAGPHYARKPVGQVRVSFRARAAAPDALEISTACVPDAKLAETSCRFVIRGLDALPPRRAGPGRNRGRTDVRLFPVARRRR